MIWVVLFVVCVIFLYSLSDSKPRTYLLPFWFKKTVQPAALYAKKYYILGSVQSLSADSRAVLGDRVTIRDIPKLIEDSAVLMAPVRQWDLAQSMRKWEVAVDLARSPSAKPVLFVGTPREIVENVTLGIDSIPGVSLRGDEEYATSCLATATSNLEWRADRRYRYRSKGYSAKEIPTIVWCIGASQDVVAKLRRHPRCTCVDVGDKDAPTDLAELCGWIKRAVDNTDHLVALTGEDSAPQMSILRQYTVGIPDVYYGTPGGPQSYKDITAILQGKAESKK